MIALLQAAVAAAEVPEHAAETAGPHAAAAAAAAAEQAGAAAAHGDPSTVLMHHVLDGPWSIGQLELLPAHKHLFFFVLAALVVAVIARLALASYKKGLPSGLGTAVESMVVFVRDDIAVKNIGHDGIKFTPLLLSFFFFILIAALLGLLPFAATSTGNIAVTLALATVSFMAQQWAGISKFGLVHHFTGMVPPGLPAWLLPIMIPVEVLGMFSKPFALMIRLFANMLAGHMVITALLMLVALMAQISTFAGVAMFPVSLGLSLFIMILEVLVAFIQAYIFTLLTAIFIGMYAHPAH